MILIVPVAAGAYVATNLDNLILLISLHARYSSRRLQVSLGYGLGMLIVGVIALVVGKAAEIIPVQYIGLLGLVPLIVGLRALFVVLRQHPPGTDPDPRTGDGRAVMVVTLVTQLSNGADTIVTFSILFADSGPATDLLISATFLAMLVLFAAAAVVALSHPWLAREARRIGHYVTPLLMIAIGAYVLTNTATDRVPGSVLG